MNENEFTVDSESVTNVAEGDKVVVSYENVHGNITSKGGKVTVVKDGFGAHFIVDTLEELEDGTPVLFKVTQSGRVKSLTGDNERRISHKFGSATEVAVLADPEDADEEITVEADDLDADDDAREIAAAIVSSADDESHLELLVENPEPHAFDDVDAAKRAYNALADALGMANFRRFDVDEEDDTPEAGDTVEFERDDGKTVSGEVTEVVDDGLSAVAWVETPSGDALEQVDDLTVVADDDEEGDNGDRAKVSVSGVPLDDAVGVFKGTDAKATDTWALELADGRRVVGTTFRYYDADEWSNRLDESTVYMKPFDADGAEKFAADEIEAVHWYGDAGPDSFGDFETDGGRRVMTDGGEDVEECKELLNDAADSLESAAEMMRDDFELTQMVNECASTSRFVSRKLHPSDMSDFDDNDGRLMTDGGYVPGDGDRRDIGTPDEESPLDKLEDADTFDGRGRYRPEMPRYDGDITLDWVFRDEVHNADFDRLERMLLSVDQSFRDARRNESPKVVHYEYRRREYVRDELAARQRVRAVNDRADREADDGFQFNGKRVPFRERDDDDERR